MIYLFYPFDDGTEFETLEGLVPGLGGVAQNHCSSKIGAICRDDGQFVAGFWNVTVGDEVYVIGHTAEGMKVLGDANKGTIDQTEVVKRLTSCSLPKNVNCKIVMYACEAGKGGHSALAAKVADALKVAQYACSNNVWGFTNKVGMKAKNGSLRIHNGGEWKDMAHVHMPSALINCPPPH